MLISFSINMKIKLLIFQIFPYSQAHKTKKERRVGNQVYPQLFEVKYIPRTYTITFRALNCIYTKHVCVESGSYNKHIIFLYSWHL
jgi:hypothetical protein